jgi:hypothetical protein
MPYNSLVIDEHVSVTPKIKLLQEANSADYKT